MALRYLARRIGVPALPRAPGSRLAQPAGAPRRLSSSSHQGGHDNGAWRPLTDAELDRRHAAFIADCDAIKEAFIKDQKAFIKERKLRRFLIGTCCTGLAVTLLAMRHKTHKERERARYWRSKLLELKFE